MLLMADILAGSGDIPSDEIMCPANVTFCTANIHFARLSFNPRCFNLSST